MSKKVKVISLILLILVCSMFVLGGCQLNYNDPDKLGVGSMNVGGRIGLGFQVALLGIGVVFLVLIVLIFFCILLKYVVNLIQTLIDKKKNNVKPVQETKAIVFDNSASSEDEEVTAAITAALMAYYSAESSQVEYKSNLKFVVRSIKKIK